jgi:hypothetical protein
MPEGTEETTAPETAAPEAAPEPAAPEGGNATGVQEPAAPEAPEPAAGPDLSDALGQLHARLDRAGVPPAEGGEEPLAPLLGQADDEWYDDFGQQGQPDPQQPQGQLTEEQQQAQQVQQMLNDAVRQQVEPIFWQQEMDRRVDGIQSFAKQNPEIQKPEVMQRVENTLSVLDPNFGQPDYAPDPRVVRTAYLAAQAELAAGGQQTSPTPAGAGTEGTAEAVGQQGATLETGAGPSVPPPDLSPEEQAWTGALKSGPGPNKFGF